MKRQREQSVLKQFLKNLRESFSESRISYLQFLQRCKQQSLFFADNKELQAVRASFVNKSIDLAEVEKLSSITILNSKKYFSFKKTTSIVQTQPRRSSEQVVPQLKKKVLRLPKLFQKKEESRAVKPERRRSLKKIGRRREQFGEYTLLLISRQRRRLRQVLDKKVLGRDKSQSVEPK